jgi:hypothetical protein
MWSVAGRVSCTALAYSEDEGFAPLPQALKTYKTLGLLMAI